MQEYLRARGLVVDLVVVNEQASTYVQDLQHAIEALCENSRARGREHGPREHIFAVRRDLIDKKSYRTLVTVARVVVHTRNGTIFDQIERAEATEMQAKGMTPPSGELALPQPVERPRPAEPVALPVEAEKPSGEGLLYWNGFGGFDGETGDYVVRLAGARATPHPWINVVANEGFGFHTSAEGASFTWSRNSRDFQLTPWSNDTVTNRPGEAIYIHDRATGAAFSPFAAVARDPAATYEARHGKGFSAFHAIRGKLAMEMTQLVDPKDPVKISRLTIRNGGFEPARLRVYAYAEWVLGINRSKSAPTIIPSHDADAGVLMARNAYSLDFSDGVAFMAADRLPDSLTADRLEFIGRKGSSVLPEAVAAGAVLSGAVEAGRDPCAALAYDVEIAPGDEATLLWLIGCAGSPGEAIELAKRHAERNFDERLAKTKKAWDGFLDTVRVETPDQALDLMVNRWLPYQALACRIRARTAFYQASGAFGFRDQLQDTLAMLTHDPSLAAAQIENAARRQFPEGDFQHWWLPRTGAGVRTTISDDAVWLAYGAAYYMKVTGDRTILDRDVPFITGEALKEGEHDSFFTPGISEEKASIYEHAARGLDLAIKRTGATGLPLILGGDWNDGMNRVGEGGKGESVWLGWFLLKTLDDFIPVARERKDDKRAARWAAHAEKLAKALDGPAWDGEWYRRGSYDDGTPLGSHLSDECRIDSIAQSWSVLSGRGDARHAAQAMDSAKRLLVDDDLDIVRLFTPAFDKTPKEPGYIKSYPPGVRENGGQYTHAATWFVIALAELGRADEAWQAFRKLNPVEHSLDEAAAERYRVEPYVVAADIYGSDDKGGRGGWTWYTGSAGWLYRAAVEGILGIRKEGERLIVAPALPGEWNGFSAVLRIGKAIYRIRVERGDAASIEIDGRKSGGNSFPIEKEGEFGVLVTVAGARAAGRKKTRQANAAE
jgi:cyclic beta-1,2-glucan synthetase